MSRIAELFEKPIERPIEEVIKVGQSNEKAVATEIGEYVVTQSLRDEFAKVLKEIADGPSEPREGIGVWVSGFFGSGKSSFAKILGYAVANRKVGNTTAPILFKRVAQEASLSDLIDFVNAQIPFEAIIFDVSMEQGVLMGGDRLTEIMYRALLRQLDYAEDFDLAELEIALEADGNLERFQQQFERKYGEHWHKRRKLGLAINEASAVLHFLDPSTYPSADSYVVAVGRGRADIDPSKLARRAFELAGRRAPGKGLIFIVDEVGQYVARSVDKMLDLSGIVQALGVEGRNRCERRLIPTPAWLVVTSQEKLDEVVTALDSKKIELARLMDRFRVTVDLRQADIAEVTARRVLAKNEASAKEIESVHAQHAARIQEGCTLERSARNLDIDAKSFVRLYPYLPYQIDLCIDIVAGLRLKRGAHRHVGGSNRTIIKQAQEMMINDRTRLADKPLGHLVTLDLVYELLEAGNLLPSEVSREIAAVATRLKGKELALKLVKAVALLESVKDLPRTAHNLAVVLHPSVDARPLRREVEAALAELEQFQFVRNTEEGYKLLTTQEKNWETKRNAVEPREADRHRLHREAIGDIFAEPKVRSMTYRDLRTFRLGVIIDGQGIEAEGDVGLNLHLANAEEWQDAVLQARNESAAQQSTLYWVVTVDEEIRQLVTELFRSREMIAEYDRLGAQQKLTPEESTCLADEKVRRDQTQRKMREALSGALEAGTTFFRGVEKQARSFGEGLPGIARSLLEAAIPALYPKLEIGTLALGGGEAEKLLAAANLNGLPTVFYGANAERSLVVKQGGQYVPNLGCDLAREIMEHLSREHAYGNKVTGKALEVHFAGLGYGWSLESIRLGLAILFRGGAVEISHQGRKYQQYSEPPARQPFTSVPAFRAASFSPREVLDLKTLAAAARMLEEIAGKDVNLEEGEIAREFKQLATSDREWLLGLAAGLRALDLPGASAIQDQLQWVEGILEAAPDDCVKTLASEGRSFLEARQLCDGIRKASTEANFDVIRKARRILDEQWPVLDARGAPEELASAAKELRTLLGSDTCLQRVEAVRMAMQSISGEYRRLYVAAFETRAKAFGEALEALKGRPEWVAVADSPAVPAEEKDRVLQPLRSRSEADIDLPDGATVCRRTGATLAQLDSDTLAVDIVAAQALRGLMALVAPQEKLERMTIAKLYPARITTEADMERFLEDLRERLVKILASGSSVVFE
jgi:hypothetical protein